MKINERCLFVRYNHVHAFLQCWIEFLGLQHDANVLQSFIGMAHVFDVYSEHSDLFIQIYPNLNDILNKEFSNTKGLFFF